MSEKARRIIKRIAELYSFGTEKKTVEEITQQHYEKLLDKEQDWDDAFKDYDVDDVLHAIDKYWRFKSDKSRPSVAQILSYLSTDNEVVKVNPNTKGLDLRKHYCIENIYFERDKALGRLKYNLPIYRLAVNRILNELLDQWLADNNQKIEDSDEAKQLHLRYSKALELGFFNEFDSILDAVAKEYENFYN